LMELVARLPQHPLCASIDENCNVTTNTSSSSKASSIGGEARVRAIESAAAGLHTFYP
jgi:hypothetical protein